MEKSLIVALAFLLVMINSLVFFDNEKRSAVLGPKLSNLIWPIVSLLLSVIILVIILNFEFGKWHIIIITLSGGFALFYKFGKAMRAFMLSIIDPGRKRFKDTWFDIYMLLMYLALCTMQFSIAVQYELQP